MDFYAVFIDLTKAFDTVNGEVLWLNLSMLGCPRRFVNLIYLFHDSIIMLLSVGEASGPFNITNVLFNIFFTCVLNQDGGKDDPRGTIC